LKRILYITRATPFPTNYGGGQRSNLILQALREMGEVDLILIGRPSFITDEHLQILRDDYGMIAHGVPTRPMECGLWPMLSKLLPRLIVKRLSHNLDGSRSRLRPDRRLINKVLPEVDLSKYDLIFGRYVGALGNLNLHNTQVSTLLDVDDLDTDVYASRIKLAKNTFQRIALSWHKHNIAFGLKQVLKGVDRAFVANKSNSAFPGLEDASHLPNIPFSSSDEQRPYVDSNPCCKNVMVIGSYDYGPNVEGVDWLVDEVWPYVVKTMPDANLKIYGAYMSDSQRERWSHKGGVQAIGYADSLEHAYRDAALSVCPTLRGAGSNIKIIESASFGRVCLLTRAAAEGYRGDEALSALLPVADSPVEMAEQIVYWLSEANERNQRSKKLYRVAKDRYSRQNFMDIVKGDVERVLKA